MRFLWGNKGNKGIHRVKKSIVQLPRGMGGLGIRKVDTLNDTLLMKQAWRMHKNPQLLVSRVYGGKGQSMLRTGKGMVLRNKRLSWDNWVNGRVREAGLNITLRQAMSWRVKDFIDRDAKSWDIRKIREAFTFADAREICSMELPISDNSDVFLWNLTKSGYAYLMGKQVINDKLDHEEAELLNYIWKRNLLPKWKILIWKVFYNGLAVKENLCYRGMSETGICDICGCQDEELNHMFTHCTNDGHESPRVLYFFATLWEIWVARNDYVFRGNLLQFDEIMSQIDQCLQEQDTFRQRDSDSLQFLHLPEMEPNQPPGFKRASIGKYDSGSSMFSIQVDGAWSKHTKRMGTGWVLEKNGMVTTIYG
ncbi:uncharacterized protein LOC110724472 [Chenopodium quinoa]|uniref:uncharacterized protein LOC110724472 n=1 Tax=Chenopodium quinoa TaxID=63459 RepID=UPI000B773A3A|nr:uncharacterized protein LOC110724472 [Chenopodium quinoa]